MIGGFQVGPFQPLPAFQQGSITVVIDTHDGDLRRKRQYEEQRQAVVRRRQQITDAIDPTAPSLTAPSAAAAQPAIAFDFDADDEEIILLL